MAAVESTICSLFSFCVTWSLSRGTTATIEKSVPAGFQHLVHPHAWLYEIDPSIRTFTGSCAHLQTNVPPLKLAAPGLTPESTDGWMWTASDMLLPSLLSCGSS